MQFNRKTPQGARPYHLDDLDRILQRFTSLATASTLKEAARDIEHNLAQYGISFEGRALPISLVPTVIPAAEVPSLAKASLLIRGILNRVLIKFTEEHRERRFDGPFHRFFTPYYKWWDMIASEERRNDHILLMRYDAVRNDHGRWSFMETNTCCPGGTIHCARIRNAWRMTRLGREIIKGEQVGSYASDRPSGFLRFMAGKAAEIDPENPNIAILNYKGTYTNELESLRACHADLRARGEIKAGELLLGDIRDLTCVGGRGYLQGKPLALVYNKLDQLAIDPANPDVQSWLETSSAPGTEFLNSLASMYLAETKRTLALLSDPNWSVYLDLSPEEEAAVQDHIPFTRLVEDLLEGVSPAQSLPTRQKESFVLKADALTRGSGVVIGDQVTAQEWTEALAATRGTNGVAQLKCSLPSRKGVHLGEGDQVKVVTEFYGVDVFLFGDEFSGLVSRSHVNQIFNVGNGGRESPVFIVGGSDA